MVARLQRMWVALVLFGTALWLVLVWPHSVVWALGGVLAGALVYLGVMAFEFALMHRVNRRDLVPGAHRRHIVRAWWAEVRSALRVFCWDQPFRSHAEPDWLPTAPQAPTGQRGVVLVHGFLCNRAMWRPWFAPLRSAGHAFEAVNLEPVFGSIDDYAPLIDAAVQRVHAATGLAPVLICHSMGGLAARAWLRSCERVGGAGAGARVHQVLTLGSPHRGTWTAQFARSGNAREMALDGEWTQALARDEPAGHTALFTCWYSDCDNVVFPASTAQLPGADNRLISGVAHVQMARHPEVIAACLALLHDTTAGAKFQAKQASSACL